MRFYVNQNKYMYTNAGDKDKLPDYLNMVVNAHFYNLYEHTSSSMMATELRVSYNADFQRKMAEIGESSAEYKLLYDAIPDFNDLYMQPSGTAHGFNFENTYNRDLVLDMTGR